VTAVEVVAAHLTSPKYYWRMTIDSEISSDGTMACTLIGGPFTGSVRRTGSGNRASS
jgi:hypothetical protein